MKQAHRFSGKGQAYEGLTELGPHGPRWSGKVRIVPELLGEPLKWKKPCRVFVNSMSDLFHEDVSNEFIDKAFAVMVLTPQHTYQVLTKRPARMKQFSCDPMTPRRVAKCADSIAVEMEVAANGDPILNALPNLRWGDQAENWRDRKRHGNGGPSTFRWPLPNVWNGISAEDQKTLWRIDELQKVHAAIRFVSLEPLLEDLGQIDLAGIHWVIVGGESGPHSRPCDIAWVRSIRDQCKTSGVACFIKQLGARPSVSSYRDHPELHLNDRKGGDWKEWPKDLRVRQHP